MGRGMVQELCVSEEAFIKICEGLRNFEIRNRDLEIGDYLIVFGLNKKTNKRSKQQTVRKITGISPSENNEGFIQLTVKPNDRIKRNVTA